jgi:ribosomal protein S14
MRDRIIIRCKDCGSAKIVGRDEIDPPEAAIMVMNECDVCNAARGMMRMQELLSALAKVGLVIAPPAPRDED